MTTVAKRVRPDELIHAELVYDGGSRVYVPARLGVPSAGQLKGTPLEQLAELAGRVCYDSLGAEKSRDSAAYHAHIREVGHLSVYEHAPVTIEIDTVDSERIDFIYALLNRPGVYIVPTRNSLRLTLNLRTLLDFERFAGNGAAGGGRHVRLVLAAALRDHAPTVLRHLTHEPGEPYWRTAEPKSDEECWVSMLMTGSRGMSHELVRHGDFTAISQRSTRYVDENESPWVEHPLIGATGGLGFPPEDPTNAVIPTARAAYESVRGTLEQRLVGLGVDKLAARKQARGAARGYLGNALYTEVLFSASVAQWHWMLHLRCSDAADAEIRLLFTRALAALQRSRYGHRFAGITLKPAADGIGSVIA